MTILVLQKSKDLWNEQMYAIGKQQDTWGMKKLLSLFRKFFSLDALDLPYKIYFVAATLTFYAFYNIEELNTKNAESSYQNFLSLKIIL